MMKTLLIGGLLLSLNLYGQHKFLTVPKLNEEDVKLLKYEKDPSEVAEVLYKTNNFQIDYNGEMYVEVVKRVKVYNKDQVDNFLSVEIPTREYKGKREVISGLKVNTYNYEDGKVKATTVSKQSKFNSKEFTDVTVTKFTFENVKNGSVLEYRYKMITPFYYTIPTVIIEEEIPVRYAEYVFDAPLAYGYNINYKGSISPSVRDVSEKNIYGGEYKATRFGYNNIPAYKNENFVYDVDNFRTSIKAELNSTRFPGQDLKLYSMSWDDVARVITEDDEFGGQLKRDGLVKDILPADIKNIASNEERANAVFNFVKKNYTWNKVRSIYSKDGLRKVIQEKTGNSAEINMLLILLMKSVHLEAFPIVMSSRGNGVILSYSPSVTSLDYVIAGLDIGNKLNVFDATSKLAKQNVMPLRAYNYSGFKIENKKAVQVNILPATISESKRTIYAKINLDGTAEGTLEESYDNIYGLMTSESYDADPEGVKERFKASYKFNFTDLKMGPTEQGDFKAGFKFNTDGFIDLIGGKMIVNPLLFLYRKEHDFNQERERRSPIEFDTGYNNIKIVTLEAPEGYVFENVPKNKTFRTEDSSIVYTYNIKQEGNKVIITTSAKVRDTIYPNDFYPAFTQIFDNVTKLESQVISLVKKS